MIAFLVGLLESSQYTDIAKTPHTRSVLPSVLTAQLITAQLDRECVGKSVGLRSQNFWTV